MTLDEAIKHAENVALNRENGLYDAIALGGQNPSQEEIDECMKCAEEHRQLAEWLKELKRYQWISVSERLPERNEIVLVSYKTTNKVHMCKYLDDGSENPWWSYNDDCSAWNNVILAWMQLPPPYEGDDEHE